MRRRKLRPRQVARAYFNLATACGSVAAALMRPLAWPLGKRRGARMLAQISADVAPIYKLDTPLGVLKFRCPSAESVKAAARFAYDEPETRWWIETVIEPGECVWDIGANVGLYALYAALRIGPAGRVLCFEPGANNYSALNDNIQLNQLSERMDAYCIALADKTLVARLALSDADAGRAGHKFQANGADAGSTTPPPAGYVPATQSAIGYSIDEFIRQFGVRAPNHIKLDVDSIEERPR